MKNLTVTVNGVAYQVTVEENTGAPAAPAAAAAPQGPAGAVAINAPMPGNILDVRVAPGDSVKAGDTLLILEAMKMENEISAPQDGTIATIDVRKGDTVSSGDLLVTMN